MTTRMPISGIIVPDDPHRGSEWHMLQTFLRNVFSRFSHEAITDRTLHAIRLHIMYEATACELWGSREFVVNVPTGTDGQPMINIRPAPMTETAYQDILGIPPENDDVDRVNCPDAGKFGHWMCGWCDHHWKPRFMCGCLAPHVHGDSEVEHG